jgi:hypothetical protein
VEHCPYAWCGEAKARLGHAQACRDAQCGVPGCALTKFAVARFAVKPDPPKSARVRLHEQCSRRRVLQTVSYERVVRDDAVQWRAVVRLNTTIRGVGVARTKKMAFERAAELLVED